VSWAKTNPSSDTSLVSQFVDP